MGLCWGLEHQVNLESASLEAYPVEAGANRQRLRAKAAGEFGLRDEDARHTPEEARRGPREGAAVPGGGAARTVA